MLNISALVFLEIVVFFVYEPLQFISYMRLTALCTYTLGCLMCPQTIKLNRALLFKILNLSMDLKIIDAKFQGN